MINNMKLEDVLAVIRNGIVSDQNDEGRGYPVTRIETISEGKINSQKVKFVELSEYDFEKYKLEEGDVLFSHINSVAHIGKTGIYEGEPRNLIHGMNLLLFRPRKDKINPRYLNYILKTNSIRRHFQARCKQAVNQASLNQDDIKTVTIPVPSLRMQEKIIKVLMRAESVLEKRRQTIQLADEFLKSVFLEMFGDPATNPKKWPLVKIRDVLLVSQYGTSKKSNNKGEGYIILGMGNITYNGEIDISKINHVDFSEKEFEKLKLVSGDIIFNRTNSTDLVGKTACWRLDANAVLASYLVKLKLKLGVVPDFFVFLLNTAYYKYIFIQRCKKAVGQSNISPTLLREFDIFLPPESAQQKFADLVQKVEKLKVKQKQSETELQNLFKSLMQRVFKGKD